MAMMLKDLIQFNSSVSHAILPPKLSRHLKGGAATIAITTVVDGDVAYSYAKKKRLLESGS